MEANFFSPGAIVLGQLRDTGAKRAHKELYPSK